MAAKAFAAFLLLFCAAPLGASDPEPVRPIVIGSKTFTESRLLAEIMAQLIEARTDIPVERKLNLGGTKLVFTAMREGEVDLYPEYTGTGWSVQLRIKAKVSNHLKTYLRVRHEFLKRYDIEWLQPFGFNNTYAMAMDKEAAERLGVRRISDLKAHEKVLSVGVSHEFLNRQDGYPGLAKAYGLKFKDIRGMEHGLAYEALRSGKLDIVDAYVTDGKLLRYSIRLLEDDKEFFPPYDAAPLIRSDALERYPELRPLLAKLAFRIDDESMRRLNARVEDEGGTYAKTAESWLRSAGLLESAERKRVRQRKRRGWLSFMAGRSDITAELALEHLYLTAVAVLLAILIAVPAGVLLTRWAPLVGPIMGAAGVIQTIPSLALLAFMLPVLGLGAPAAVAALFLYALLPILRNTYTGIMEVDTDLTQAARAMGLTKHQILLKVELPLATRTIMAGIRTSTVISIGVATLAAFIGAGGLGDPIITGLQLNDNRLILSGAVPAALLAIAADFLMGRLEKLLVPRGLD